MLLPDAIRQFLEYGEVERGRSPATVRLYAFVLARFAAFAAAEHRRQRFPKIDAMRRAGTSSDRAVATYGEGAAERSASPEGRGTRKTGFARSQGSPTARDVRGAPRTEDVTLELIRQFRLWLHRRPGRRGAAVSRRTEHLHLVVIRAFLKYLATRDIPSLAADKVELPKVPDREVEFLEPEEVERLLSAPLARGKTSGVGQRTPDVEERVRRPSPIALRDKAILEMLFSTGMRVGELVSLQRDDVNLKRGEFAVRGKGDKVRVVFLSDDATVWLKRYLEARTDLSPHLLVRHDRASRRKPTAARRKPNDDRPLTARSVERLVARYARAAGIVKPVHPHTLRHSFATDLLRGGAQLRDVQAMLGHASITTTQVYTHVTEAHLKEVHARHHRRRKSGGT